MKIANLLLILPFLIACAAARPADPDAAQTQLRAAWRQPWRGVWELNWAQSPLPGSLVFEGWQTAAGAQRRYEILEAPVPAWVGLTYVNNGATAGYTNRLEPTVSVTGFASSLPFSPISDALAAVDDLLGQPALSAERQPAGVSTTELIFRYPEDQTLSLWLDTQTQLVIRVELRSKDIELTLAARSMQPLRAPHPALFELED